MHFRTLETLYGPRITADDWTADSGTAEAVRGGLRITGSPLAELWRDDYPHGGGGDVSVTVTFTIERIDPSGSVTLRFNRKPRKQPRPDRGFAVELSAGELRVLQGEEPLGSAPHRGSSRDVEHTISLFTLGEDYALEYCKTLIASGRMRPPFVDNEGWLELECREATVLLTAVQEDAIAHEMPPREWARTELLYRETWDAKSLERHWVLNTEGKHATPVLTPQGCVFRHTSNCLLRQRFDAPVAVDYVARPVPTSRFSAGVTDAVFLWMADICDGDLIEYLRKQTRAGKAGLEILVPHPLYWVDFGGSNNVTTRLRKNPSRHLMRQYSDPPRLLEQGRAYRISTVQIAGFVEFWVDGEPMIRVYDPHPLTSGHVGVRAFCADLELRSLAVWRIA